MSNVGEKIINAIVDSKMFRVEAHEGANLIVWSGNAAEQLTELVNRREADAGWELLPNAHGIWTDVGGVPAAPVTRPWPLANIVDHVCTRCGKGPREHERGNIDRNNLYCRPENLPSPSPAGGWIRTSERMPAEGETVVAFTPDKLPHYCKLPQDVRFWTAVCRDGYFDNDDISRRYGPDRVTHWMPLSPPDRKANGD